MTITLNLNGMHPQSHKGDADFDLDFQQFSFTAFSLFCVFVSLFSYKTRNAAGSASTEGRVKKHVTKNKKMFLHYLEFPKKTT